MTTTDTPEGFDDWTTDAQLAYKLGRSEQDAYNGWKNYPTWAVALWLDNDEALYNETRSLTRMHVSTAPDDENAQPQDGREPIWTVEETARFRLADTLKAWVRDDLAPDLGASFASDLLGWALDHVAWDEIAQSRIDAEAE